MAFAGSVSSKTSSHYSTDRVNDFSTRCLSVSTDSLQLEEETVTFVRSFAVNNRHTGNLSALVHNFLVRAEEMKVCSKLDEYGARRFVDRLPVLFWVLCICTNMAHYWFVCEITTDWGENSVTFSCDITG